MFRRKAFWLAAMNTVFGVVECRVLDLSLRGAKVQVGVPVAVGQAVTLELDPLGEFEGSVAWKRDGAVGIKFREQRAEGDWNRIKLGRLSAAKRRKTGAAAAR